ncbi:hypothetical protein [Kutzneria chonburiensis]|uniref:DUF4231 domain-containing protein n=1 Tax=Kutzneria chonburiensis TaxID=1483604 RepID=A0ABV6MQ47_9PSEU|nr:hypothetical protein [Kutzneria chonburiensis]
MLSHDKESWDAAQPETDLEAALEHAEQMLASYDRAARELRYLYVARNGILVASPLVIAVIVLSSQDFATGLVLVLGFMAGLLGLAALLHEPIVAAHRRRERDLSGLVPIARVVRDTLPVVAKAEHWGELRHLTMRARIARFPISEKST